MRRRHLTLDEGPWWRHSLRNALPLARRTAGESRERIPPTSRRALVAGPHSLRSRLTAMSGDLCNGSSLLVSPAEAAHQVAQASSSITPVACEPAFHLLIVTCRPLYGDTTLPEQLGKKIFRLVNDIPFGPGKLPNTSAEMAVSWRYLQDGHVPISNSSAAVFRHTFMSAGPIAPDAALETRRHLRRELTANARAVFGDTTAAVTVMLTRCLSIDADLVINDIAKNSDSSLVFSH